MRFEYAPGATPIDPDEAKGLIPAHLARLIAIYRKGIKDDLNAAEKKTLKKLNENW